MSGVPFWIEAFVSALLLLSGLLSLVASIGIVRLKAFFQRMHPPALANTCGAWCVTLGTIIYFSSLEGRPALYACVINILVAITAPVTTTLLARAALFRQRQRDEDVPPALRIELE